MAMKRKFIIYAPVNRNYGYCRLHFGYQIIIYIYIYIYIYIPSMIETSRLMLIKLNRQDFRFLSCEIENKNGIYIYIYNLYNEITE